MLPTVFVTTWKEIGLSWFQRLVNYRQKLLPTNYKLTRGNDKSFADDLVESGYCKCESSLCATIHWDFSRVATICSSLFWNVLAAYWIHLGSVGRQIFFASFLIWVARRRTEQIFTRVASQLLLSYGIRQRPYRNEYTGSLPNSEVNRCRARSVLGWGTAWEVLWVLLAFSIDCPSTSNHNRLQLRTFCTVAILAQGL